MTNTSPFPRRSLLKLTAGLSALPMFSTIARAEESGQEVRGPDGPVRMADVPLAPTTKVTVERSGQFVLIGINRPSIQNRVDPETFVGLAKAYYDYDHDPTLRAAVLFGHGPNFSRGIDVDGFRALLASGKALLPEAGVIDPLGGSRTPRLSKPLIVAVHGDTWNMGHELHLAADIRIASADTNFGQDENTHGRFPGGGSTIRFVREAGWGNAMRYMLTGDHWGAEEAHRMGVVQEVSSSPAEALQAGIALASKIAACGPIGVRTTLASSHLAIDASEVPAFARLEDQYRALYRTDDFKEGRAAEAEGRPPVYRGQ
jgi:enoyl-CoA hydratase